MNNTDNQPAPCNRANACKLFQKLALAGSIALVSAGGVQAQTGAFYGDQALNPSIQPNVLNEGRVHFDYYGSGDANGDGVIDYQDYLAMQNNLSNDRTDLNGDGVTDSLDLALMNQFLTGQIKYLPAHWDLLQTEAERIDWLEKTVAIDSTNFIPWSSLFNCQGFSNQMLVNFSGIENISGSGLNYGPNYGQMDSTKNARFNIPIYFVATRASDANNTAHAINAVLVGDSATNFSDWYFLEPQNDSRVYPGDFSMSLNSYANLNKRFYRYSDFLQIFSNTNQFGVVAFDLYNGQDSLSFHQTAGPGLTITRTPVPLEPINETLPNDTLIEIGNPTDTSSTGYVTNITPGAHVNYTDSIDSINVDNHDIYRTFSWKPHHRYIDSIAPTTPLYEYPWTWLNVDSLGTQKIEVRDTQPPTIVSVPNPLNINYGDSIPNLEEVIFTDNSNAPLNINYTDSTTQNPDTLNLSHYNYDLWKKVIASDISGNITDTTYLYAEIRDTQPPIVTNISSPYSIPFGEQIPQPQITYTENSKLPVNLNIKDSITQSIIPDSCSYFNYEQWIKAELTDASGNKTDTTFKNANIYKPNTSIQFTKVPKDTIVDKYFEPTQALLHQFIEVDDMLYGTNAIQLTHDTVHLLITHSEEHYGITTTALGGCGCTRDTTWRLIKQLDTYVNIPDTASFTFSLYPVPAGKILYLAGDGLHATIQYMVYDSHGNSQASGIFTHDPNHPQAISLAGLAPGVYILQIHTGENSYSRRFIKGW